MASGDGAVNAVKIVDSNEALTILNTIKAEIAQNKYRSLEPDYACSNNNCVKISGDNKVEEIVNSNLQTNADVNIAMKSYSNILNNLFVTTNKDGESVQANITANNQINSYTATITKTSDSLNQISSNLVQQQEQGQAQIGVNQPQIGYVPNSDN